VEVSVKLHVLHILSSAGLITLVATYNFVGATRVVKQEEG